ncbi:MAG: hypothetical protein QOE43_812, partial [Gaiellaceae bacterium]|nr:hypothetical protein [Gaiellaceae bacterium]
RHSDEPQHADHRGCGVVADDLDPDAAGQNEGCRAKLRADLRERRQTEDVVGEACEVEDRAAAENAAELPRGRNEPCRECDPDGGEEPRHDPAAAQERSRAFVPAVRARRRHDVTRGRGAQQAPDRQEACRQRGKGSHGDRHGNQRNEALYGRCLGRRIH